MKEIKLMGLNETVYEHTHKSGLKTYMWVNEKVNGCYMTLSVRYGSIHTEFKIDNKKIKVPYGLAHFLEHIKFNISETKTAHDIFTKLGGDINAFTTFNFTSYLVFCSNSINENLKNLIDFVYNPFFSKKSIQKEKGIIVEESKMNEDDPYTASYYHLLKNIFKEYKHKEFITGLADDINQISQEDVENVFDYFYHPKNMFLCITGNFNPYEMAKVVDETLNEKKFPRFKKPAIICKKEPKEVVKEYEECEMNVITSKVRYALKIPKIKFKGIDEYSLRIILNLILSINFGQTSEIKEELISKGLIASLSSSAEIYGDYVLLTVFVDTEYPDEVIKRIKKQFNSLDLNEKAFKRKQKADIASLILDFDDIESVNTRFQDDIILYDEIINDAMDRYRNITYQNFKDIAKKIDSTNKSVLVINPKKENEDNKK